MGQHGGCGIREASNQCHHTVGAACVVLFAVTVGMPRLFIRIENTTMLVYPQESAICFDIHFSLGLNF